MGKSEMKKYWEFIKSKRFIKHLGGAIAGISLLLLLVFWGLSALTNHDEYYKVPDFTGVAIEDLDAFVEDKNIRYRIIDSVYNNKAPGGTVLRQEPLAETEVKDNRMIYLYVVARVPQQITMPNLVDASPRQAVALLESYGLKLLRTVKKPGQSAVLAQLYRGKVIAAGTSIAKGSEIELWIGKGEEGETVGVPCVNGLNLEDAINELTAAGLAMGAVVCKECRTSADSARAIVFRQSPSCGGDNLVNSGTSVDIFLTLDNKQDPKIDVPDTKNSNEPGKGK